MRLLAISLRNIKIRLVSSALTLTTVAVATALYASILLMLSQTNGFYNGSISGYQAIVGTKDASQLEICLNTIFNVGTAPGIVRTDTYELVRSGRMGRGRGRMAYTIPQGRGDTYSPNNYPVIGTTDEMFLKFERSSGDGERRPLPFAAGAPWSYTHDDFMGTAQAIADAENTKLDVDLVVGDVEAWMDKRGLELPPARLTALTKADDDGPAYWDEVPKDAWGNPFRVVRLPEGSRERWAVVSNGADGVPHSAELESDNDDIYSHLPGMIIDIREEWKRAVVGSRVARVLGLTIGDVIVPRHGNHDTGADHTRAACEICGILAPTNSPIDSSIFVPLGVQLVLGGHRALQPKNVPGQAPEPYVAGDVMLTAVVCDPLDHMGDLIVRRALASQADGQMARPKDVIPKFLDTIGKISDVLEIVAWLVLVVAAIAIAVAMFNTMNERRREIAIMRSLGARRGQIAAIIVFEAALLSLLGTVLGVAACHFVAWATQATVEDMTGVYVDWTAFSIQELYLVVGVTGLGAIAGILPAVKGSLTQVADNLSPTT